MALLETDLLHIFLSARIELQRFLLRRLQCADTAADLVQEVYLRLPQLSPPPCNELAARAWLFKVAANLAIDHARTHKRRGELLETYFPVEDDSACAPQPEQTLLAREQLEQIQAALAELPEQCAHVLYLSRVEGLSHAEIARQLGISKSWVEKQLLRALGHCRKALPDA